MSMRDRLAYLCSMKRQGGKVMKRSVGFISLLVLSVAGGCAGSRPEARTDSGALVALGPNAAAASPAVILDPAAKVPEEVLHDPAARFAYAERLRTQIVARTRGYSEARYWNEARPLLRRQLESAGLPRADVDLLLAEVDQSRRR
jgi:hypothetical protein